jgi:hypothetical protein
MMIDPCTLVAQRRGHQRGDAVRAARDFDRLPLLFLVPLGGIEVTG